MTAAEKYANIINLPGPQRDELFLRRHPRMPLSQRAKIFSPFAALAGYDQVIKNKNVLYEPRRELDPEEREALDNRLQRLAQLTRNGRSVRENPVHVKVEYFSVCTDPWNDAYGRDGLYKTLTGLLRRVDPINQSLQIGDEVIPFDDIYRIRRVAV